jgi:tetratricopeptide (TPR) repeat protein
MLFSLGGISQSKKNLYIKGQKSLDDKDYFSAAQYFNQLIMLDSTQIVYQYKYAEASRLNYDLDIALYWYQKVMKIDNARMYPETPFWIASLIKSKARYKEAKKYFEKFYKANKSSKEPTRKRLVLKAKQEMEACDDALILISNPVNVTIEHLDTTVNSKVSEYAPFEADTALYFSSLRYTQKSKKDINNVAYNKLYTSRKVSEKWEKAKELDSLFNASNIHNANTSFNEDLTRIFVSRCTAINSTEYTCQIYFSQYVNGHWTVLKPLPAPINIYNTNTTQPNVGKLNGKDVLFFSSNRPGGQGGMDIWYSEFDKSLHFEDPVNAGKKVNSAEDEITPWFVKENNTLYYSSTWHKGLGGFDIFKSLFSNNEFVAPENAGYPINSSYNDIYYSVNNARDRVYISSNRLGSYFEEKQSCCNDIYSFSIPKLTIPEVPKPIDTTKVLMDQLRVLVPLTLYFHNDEPDPKTKNITTKKNYKKTYEEYIALKGSYYTQYTEGLLGDEKSVAENRLLNFFEDSVDAGMHDLDKFAVLLEEVLARGENVKITMKGYCSPLASTDYNVNLAKRRISSLRNYFMEYKGGIFAKYINTEKPEESQLVMTDVDIGELPVSKVSDDVKDVKNSVYSPFAAAERKIQIIAVSSFAEIK